MTAPIGACPRLPRQSTAIPDDLSFDVPHRHLSPEELADVAKAVAAAPSLWESALEQTTAERTYADVFTNERLGVWAIS